MDFLGRNGAYNEERDGPIERYLETHNGISTFPLFTGYDSFKMLLDKGYIIPGRSIIRLMWNIGREDEHFFVLDEKTLEGISNIPAHAGREGRFNVKKLLGSKDCPCWEAQRLNPNPKSN